MFRDGISAFYPSLFMTYIWFAQTKTKYIKGIKEWVGIPILCYYFLPSLIIDNTQKKKAKQKEKEKLFQKKC